MDTALKTNAVGCFAEVRCGGVCREVTEEYIVPDSLPDVGEILDAEGVLTMSGKDMEIGAVQLSGSLAVSVVYRPEAAERGGLQGMELTIPIAVRLDADGADTDCRTTARLRLQSIAARAVNSRKISVRAEIEAGVCCYRDDRLVLSVGMEAESSDAHIRLDECDAMLVTDVREKTFAVTDDCAIPAAAGSGARILSQRVELLCEDIKYVSGKALFRGRVRAALLFAGTDSDRACAGRYETEFSQIMEIEAAGEGDVQPEITLFLTGAYFDLPGWEDEPGKLRAEYHMGAQCVCRVRRRLSYISDAYSNRTVLLPKTEPVSLIRGVRPVVMRQTVADRLAGAERDAELLLEAASVNSLSVEEGCVRTNVDVRVVYALRDGGYASARGRLSAEFTLQDLTGAETLQDVSVTVTDVYVVPGNGDVRVSLRLDASAVEETVIDAVTGLEEDEAAFAQAERAPSAVMLRLPDGADLWAAAKRYHSTEEAILQVNEGRRAGLLLIPKSR